jgi:hypothetical protein
LRSCIELASKWDFPIFHFYQKAISYLKIQ